MYLYFKFLNQYIYDKYIINILRLIMVKYVEGHIWQTTISSI